MLKRIGLSAMLLGGILAIAAPRPAKAEVHFGVYVGAPAYTYPAYPAYPAYPDYYYNDPAPVYAYPAPTYVAPYAYAPSYRLRDRDRHEWREHERHERHEWRERQDRGGRGWRR